MANLSLTLGSVTFQNFELPETLDSVGSRAIYKKHEFPGGTITIRSIGAFPLPVSWKGYLSGQDAFDRMAALERMVVTGQTVTLSYGRWSWLGELVLFDARPRHQFLVPYVLHFEPLKDLSGIGTTPAGTPSPESQIQGYSVSITNLQTTTLTGP